MTPFYLPGVTCQSAEDCERVFLRSAFLSAYTSEPGAGDLQRLSIADDIEDMLQDGTQSTGTLISRNVPLNVDRLEAAQAQHPSAKVKMLLKLLDRWKLDAPDEKIVVYSQWTSFIDSEILLEPWFASLLRIKFSHAGDNKEARLQQFAVRW